MSTQTFSNQMPLKASSEELAQNGVRREAVPQRSGGARRTLCAFMPLNGSIARKQLWTGRVTIGLTTLFMLMDGIMKIVKPAPVVEASGKLGFPEATLSGIGFALIVCTLMYAIPRSSVFGAILLTGYLGGAVASQVRAGSGSFELVFPILFAALVWGGLWLRDGRMRRILELAVKG